MHHNRFLPGMFRMLKAAYETQKEPGRYGVQQDCLSPDSMVGWAEKVLELVLTVLPTVTDSPFGILTIIQ